MANAEWGVKRLCPSCGVRFYDLTNDPCTCPGCGSSFTLEQLSERKSTSAAAGKVKPETAAKVDDVVESEEDDDDVLDDSLGDDVLIDDDDDDSDLGDLGGDIAATGDEEES